ncbi:MAG: hypothetical protein R3C68_02825 [Myxococcota bacterium]
MIMLTANEFFNVFAAYLMQRRALLKRGGRIGFVLQEGHRFLVDLHAPQQVHKR